MGGWWVVGAKIKSQQGLMKDRVREMVKEGHLGVGYSKYFVRFSWKYRYG